MSNSTGLSLPSKPRSGFNRRSLMIAFGIAILACGIIGLGIAMMSSGLTREDYNRIQIGMTDAEVEAILGRRPDASLLLLGRVAGPEMFASDGQTSWHHYHEWNGARVSIVTFTDPKTGRVVCRYSGQGYVNRYLPWQTR